MKTINGRGTYLFPPLYSGGNKSCTSRVTKLKPTSLRAEASCAFDSPGSLPDGLSDVPVARGLRLPPVSAHRVCDVIQIGPVRSSPKLVAHCNQI